MDPAVRARCLKILYSVHAPVSTRDDGRAWFRTCRDVEAMCHAQAHSAYDYEEAMMRATFHLKMDASRGSAVVHASDDELMDGTLVERIQAEARARQQRFEQMLQDKYEAVDDPECRAMVRCRRCGSSEVTWEEKQTRSADEGASVFFTCTTCSKVWVHR